MYTQTSSRRVPTAPTTYSCFDVLDVRLTRRDVSAIDLALRLVLATSTSRSSYYEEMRRALAKLPPSHELGAGRCGCVPPARPTTSGPAS